MIRNRKQELCYKSDSVHVNMADDYSYPRHRFTVSLPESIMETCNVLTLSSLISFSINSTLIKVTTGKINLKINKRNEDMFNSVPSKVN